jgi:hypothetical protein
MGVGVLRHSVFLFIPIAVELKQCQSGSSWAARKLIGVLYEGR